jgi:hypothetical protein
MHAGFADLADLFVTAKLACKGLFKGYGSHRADGSAPTTVHAAVHIDQRPAFHPEAAVLCQVPITQLNAGLRTYFAAQAAMNAAFFIDDRGLEGNAQV